MGVPEEEEEEREKLRREGRSGEGRERERQREEQKKIFEEIMAENFPNLRKNTNLHTQEAQQIPNRINTEIHTHTHHSKNDQKQR